MCAHMDKSKFGFIFFARYFVAGQALLRIAATKDDPSKAAGTGKGKGQVLGYYLTNDIDAALEHEIKSEGSLEVAGGTFVYHPAYSCPYGDRHQVEFKLVIDGKMPSEYKAKKADALKIAQEWYREFLAANPKAPNKKLNLKPWQKNG